MRPFASTLGFLAKAFCVFNPNQFQPPSKQVYSLLNRLKNVNEMSGSTTHFDQNFLQDSSALF
jgi:hypothetical protein